MASQKKEVIEQKKQHAYDLYINTDLYIKDIAVKVGADRKTVGKWADDGGWEEIKKAATVNNEALVAKLQSKLMEELKKGVPVFDRKTWQPIKDGDGNQVYRPITSDEISKQQKAINELRDNRVLMSHRYLTMKELFQWHAGKYPHLADERKRLADISDAFINDKANGAQ